jgi:nucleotide-binding universal stress UspA family protein
VRRFGPAPRFPGVLAPDGPFRIPRSDRWFPRTYDDGPIATDGSHAVRDATDEAIGIAELTGAALHAVSVVDTADYVAVPDPQLLTLGETLGESLGYAGRRAVAAVQRRAAGAGLETHTGIREGSPADGILAYADERDVALVVTGARGRSTVDRVLLGSVAEAVVRNVDRPVLAKRLGP